MVTESGRSMAAGIVFRRQARNGRKAALLGMALAAAFLTAIMSQSTGWCTRLPGDAKKISLQLFGQGSLRLDGSIALPNGLLALPLLPSAGAAKKGKEPAVAFPNADNPVLVFYESGWGHLRLTRKGDALTVALPANLPEPVSKRLLGMHFPPDLIVPEGLVLPRSLKPLAGELNIPLVDDTAIERPDFGQKQAQVSGSYTGKGKYALISVSHGTIVLVDGNTMAKVAEFPTEGTPCGMEFVGQKLYITDQAKDRILILDPSQRKFLGQIDLAPRSTPKGIKAMPNGSWLYVSESGPSNIAVIETASNKMLVKTKVPTGPGSLAITPDGVYLVVLNVSAGELSVLATYNQKLVGSLKVGTLPTCVAIHPREKIAYVSNRRLNTVSVIDISKRQIITTLKTGASPTGVVLSPDGARLYVAHGQDNTIWVIDTQNPAYPKLQEIRLPVEIEFPGPMCLSPDGSQLLVTSQQTDNIAIVDTQAGSPIKLLAVGHPTHDIIWVPAD